MLVEVECIEGHNENNSHIVNCYSRINGGRRFIDTDKVLFATVYPGKLIVVTDDNKSYEDVELIDITYGYGCIVTTIYNDKLGVLLKIPKTDNRKADAMSISYYVTNNKNDKLEYNAEYRVRKDRRNYWSWN